MHSSPMLRFSLELYTHSLKAHLGATDFERKLAVLSLAQAVELAVKAALVEDNISVYEHGNKTVNTHTAREKLGKAWKSPVPSEARIELLIDERNAMQHRYGSVDPLTLEYHIETVTEFLRALLDEKFDESLDDYVAAALPTDIANLSRFVKSTVAVPAAATPGSAGTAPSPAATSASDPTLELIGAFMEFERGFRERVTALGVDERSIRSVLDVTMKFVANITSEQDVVRLVPGVFTLRNAVVHGATVPDPAQVGEARQVLSRLSAALRDEANTGELALAIQASSRGEKGTRLRPALRSADDASTARTTAASPVEASADEGVTEGPPTEA